MEISKYFFNILKSIDYYSGHLPRDLFANEEKLPELLPVFTWFNNNISPASNCVKPKELALFLSISSKHNDYSSIEKVTKAIDSFYDENTKDSKVSSSDLETLKRNILKSKQELNDLKSQGTLYEKKICLMNDEISVLKQKENIVSTSWDKIDNNLYLTLKKFAEKVDALDLSINKLHNQVISSMTDDNICLTKLASKNLVHLTDAWRQQIFKMINVWFKEESISPVANNNISSMKIHTLSVLSQSVAALKMAEIDEQFNIAKLKVAVTNILNMKNNFIDMENLFLNEPDIMNYTTKFLKQQEILIHSYEQSTFTEYKDLQSHLSDIVIADAKSKLSELERINNRITFIQDSIEHYIMINDVLWCLMRTSCSMANLKCELILHCIHFLEKTLDDIDKNLQWTSNYLETTDLSFNGKNTNITPICGEVVNFKGYKRYSSIYTNSDEIEKISKIVQLWKSKYHYCRDQCNKLTILQQKLQVYNDIVNGLTTKYSNAM